jgi:hypothetical protein
LGGICRRGLIKGENERRKKKIKKTESLRVKYLQKAKIKAKRVSET